jgi:predicted  nucleic acid-binding Zn-ribbon protein
MSTLTAKEALQALAPLSKQFRALHRLEEALLACADLDRLESAAKERLEDAEGAATDANERHQQVLATLEAEFAKKHEDLQDKLDRAQDEAEAKTAALWADYARAEKDKISREDKLDQIVGSLEKTRDGLAAEVKALTARRDELAAETASLRDRLSALLK